MVQARVLLELAQPVQIEVLVRGRMGQLLLLLLRLMLLMLLLCPPKQP